ncbi:MAG: ABC transporter permease [Phycisphaerales bacterium]|nr:ABC transporter permease [Phycisphaerales bacterium]
MSSLPTSPSNASGKPGEPSLPEPPPPAGLDYLVAMLGERALSMVRHIGAITLLFGEVSRWIFRSFYSPKVRIGRPAIVTQIVRIGVRSIGIVSLVSGCVGLILAFQLSPPLDEFGQKDKVANIVGVAVLRELGPLIAAIVLTGFAGASIAAEIGTMVVGEEIEALEAHAMNPVKFLVVPRVVASILSLTCLSVISNVVAVAAALGIAMLALDISYASFMSNFFDQVKLVDFVTGVSKGAVFGILIAIIACYNGLKVTGGAAGVGQATTGTVVQSVVAVIICDLVFTTIFFALKLV